MRLAVFILLLNLLSIEHIHSQTTSEGAKPKISVNGVVCAIENQQFSCVTRTCDSVMIYPGDSVRFCTDANFDLSSDTAYFVQWEFNGSSNYTQPVHDHAPTSLPLCYDPVWTTPGTYTVNIFNNNFLTAYPGSDCFTYGPSHWQIIIIVANTNSINDSSEEIQIAIYPNPAQTSTNIRADSAEHSMLTIYNSMGTQLASFSFHKERLLDISSLPRGFYLFNITNYRGPLSTSRTFIKE